MNKILIFDIESKISNEKFPNATNISDEIIHILNIIFNNGQIVKYLISTNIINPIDNLIVKNVNSESELLLEWCNLLREINPDSIIGYNICGYHFEYIKNRVDTITKTTVDNIFAKLFYSHNDLFWQEEIVKRTTLGIIWKKYFQFRNAKIIDIYLTLQQKDGFNKLLQSYKLDKMVERFLQQKIQNTFYKDKLQKLMSGSIDEKTDMINECVNTIMYIYELMQFI